MARKKNRNFPPDKKNRDLIVSELDRCMLVEAAAGTGKTASMVSRMIALLATGKCKDIRTMAAVTFTRKAAAELRGRFRIGLERGVRDSEGKEKIRLENALSDIDKCFIGTIHSFCARLLRERPVEANIDVAFEELDDVEDARIRNEAWDTFVDAQIANEAGGILDKLVALGINPSNLKEEFIKYADYPDVGEWPLPKPKGAPANLATSVENLLAYVDDMRGISSDFPDDCMTDTLIPRYRIISRMCDNYENLNETPQLLDVLVEFNKKPKVTQYVWKATGKYDGEDAKAELERFLEYREREVIPLINEIYESRYGPVMQALEEARKVYDRLRHNRGFLNYQDLLMKAAGLLKANPNVREYFSRRFTHLLVDEFQDTDPIQAEVMLLLASTDPRETEWRKCRPRPGSLFVVGDPKQSIYRFRRADIVTYNQVKEIIEKGDGVVVELSTNFRTTGEIIEWVNEVFEPKGIEKKVEGAMRRFPQESSPESPCYVHLEKGREDVTSGGLSGVYVLAIPEDHSNKQAAIEYEANRIARTIRHMIDTKVTVPRSRRELDEGKTEYVDYSDFLIITRNTTNLGVYAKSLQELGIPHQVTGGTALNEVYELKLLYLCLSAVVQSDNPVALVGTLRSELFGVSDAALFNFKRAGGVFSYHSALPDGLKKEESEAIGDAFSRLKRYSMWISTLPSAAAIEKIIADVGLMVLASSREGGDVLAGGIAKAMELIRSVRGEMWTAAQLVDYLGQIVEIEEKYDGISVRSEERPMVRVMNLHKVKGLEAPIVFLADTSGEFDHGIDLHIDRAKDDAKGYMVIYGPAGGHQSKIIARPESWEIWEEIETGFKRAEELRLRYVAATRAGAAMIISQRMRNNSSNPWQYFDEYIPENREIEDPGEQRPPKRKTVTMTEKAAQQASDDISTRLEESKQKTYEVIGAKEYALHGVTGASFDKPGEYEETYMTDPATEAGEHGVEWGTVIHSLLELAMREPEADLVEFAKPLLAENELDTSLAQKAVDTVQSVTSSEIWKRARTSEKVFTEVPFQIHLSQGEVPTVVRGVIDLVFKEKDGWVLVDYKTDSFEGKVPDSLISKYSPQVELYVKAWQKATGDPVKEKGIYFIQTGSLVSVT